MRIESILYQTYPVYVAHLPDEAIPKIRQEKIFSNEKLSRLKQSLTSKHECAELSLEGVIDLIV